ncbi:hypothetical protein BV898_06691 [Hypsibius exemplaris]|uniref:Uncharacterized protein n=1 Tax=Hypsibius exemplaris TaxID=2072580 RepID=A0A1W0WVM8_HYPEX|nr:hypothetical protein BV898_06691 [Hypsibius exemplaris]
MQSLENEAKLRTDAPTLTLHTPDRSYSYAPATFGRSFCFNASQLISKPQSAQNENFSDEFCKIIATSFFNAISQLERSHTCIPLIIYNNGIDLAIEFRGLTAEEFVEVCEEGGALFPLLKEKDFFPES